MGAGIVLTILAISAGEAFLRLIRRPHEPVATWCLWLAFTLLGAGLLARLSSLAFAALTALAVSRVEEDFGEVDPGN